MVITVEQLIKRAGELPPIPQAAQKALLLIRNPDTNIGEIAEVMAVDQVLTSLVLRWANSAYYGIGNHVSTVQQAVMVLGLNTVQSLILASSVASYLDRPVPGYELERGELWKHAIGVATGARMLASRFGRQIAEEAYHAGLLCDIGKLAFEILLRNVSVDRPEWKELTFLELERAKFGIDHATLGAEMARRWNLPDNLVSAIAFHHTPSKAGEHAKIAAAVHVSDAAMMMLGHGIGKDGLQYKLEAEALKLLTINENGVSDLIERMAIQIKELESFIGFEWKSR
jgi:putative nucleotidyltransferase with HDIG domain